MPAKPPRSPWQIYNLLLFVIMVLMNILANALPINGITTAEVSDSLPSLFTPAGFTFAIWGVIYLLLGAFAVLQSGFIPGTRSKARLMAEAVGPWFVVSSLANSLWILAWHYEFIFLTVVLMLVILGSLLLIDINIRRQKGVPPLAGVAFGVYLGWISVATIANITSYLVSIQWKGFGLSHVTWTLIVLAVAGIIGVLKLRLHRDIWFSMVIIWAFFGIVMQHVTFHSLNYLGIVGLAGGVMALLLFGIVNQVLGDRDDVDLEEDLEAEV